MRVFRPFLKLFLVLIIAASILGQTASASRASNNVVENAPAPQAASTRQYLPITFSSYPLRSPFLGFEIYGPRLSSLAEQADQLGGKWFRLNILSWRQIQPTPQRVYNWEAAAGFEEDLRAAFRAGLTPIVVVDDHPRWATTVASSCAPIKQEFLGEFAVFMRELVLRYRDAPYNVHNWELGNEPDVRPGLVVADNQFGCWGNDADPYYGGEYYGNMIKAVSPSIKQADPGARVWIGGLLLNNPATCPQLNTPACFFEGILRSGAAPFFDVVAYHAYAQFDQNSPKDHSGITITQWGAPGFARGKPRFLKEVMGRYGVSKPLFMNESSLRCPAILVALCAAPSADFFEDQANHASRLIARTLSEGVEGVIWYPLEGPGWDNSGLLDGSWLPRPSYRTIQTLAIQTANAAGVPVLVNYGAGTEAYRFSVPGKRVDLVWSLDSTPDTISIPANEFLAAYSREGLPPPSPPVIANGIVSLSVGFEAIYVQRRP